jgi:hypothetical protein
MGFASHLREWLGTYKDLSVLNPLASVLKSKGCMLNTTSCFWELVYLPHPRVSLLLMTCYSCLVVCGRIALDDLESNKFQEKTSKHAQIREERVHFFLALKYLTWESKELQLSNTSKFSKQVWDSHTCYSFKPNFSFCIHFYSMRSH